MRTRCLTTMLTHIAVFVGFLATMAAATAWGQDAMTPAVTTAAAVERLGVASLLVLAFAWMLRYFMGLLEKKETRLTELTDRSLTAAAQTHMVMVEFKEVARELHRTNQELTHAIAELNGAMRREPRKS